MVLVSKDENEILKNSVDTNIAKGYEERLEFLEREINKDKQNARRDSVEIMDISPDDDGWMDGRTDGGTDGGTDGRMEGRRDRRTDG